jgi:sulfur-oxidizing protein SoxB
MENNRRDFLKKLGTLSASIGLFSSPTDAFAKSSSSKNKTNFATNNNPFKISILQTTDVHCQVHPHDELFWENDKSVFRKTGGYAHLATYLDKTRKKYEDSFLIDTGDMFQGSELIRKNNR